MSLWVRVLVLVLGWASFLLSCASAREHFRTASYGLWQPTNNALDVQHEVNVMIALHPRNKAALERRLLEAASPGSPVFRQYMKPSEVSAFVAPAESDIQRVLSWLAKYDILDVEMPNDKDWVRIRATIAQVEGLLQCELAQFVHEESGRRVLNAVGSYAIPDVLDDIIEFVAGLHTFPAGRWRAIKENPLTVAQQITPQTVYDNYGTDTSGSHGSKLGSQAVVEFGKLANFIPSDVEQFFEEIVPELSGETCGVVYGTNNPKGVTSVEANLDVEYIMAVGVYVNTSDYKIDLGEDIESEMLDYAYIVNNQTEPPLVQSISYGEYGGSYDNATDQRFSYELQKMGMKGISVLLASGDIGVGCGDRCESQEFTYPDSPYLTMVGATYIDTDNIEKGATLSSGGFSKNFYRPSWQDAAVEAYFSSDVQMPTSAYYADGRAYPDVSAYGQNLLIVSSGKQTAVSGTSCSAPIFAGLVALINHELMSVGKPPLGWLNPWLYSNPNMFTDILDGSNPYSCCDGFYATSGWDPVTGMGSPIYSAMLASAIESS